MQRGERLLIEAPTGSGKTLIAFLAVAISGSKSWPWRGMMVVPSRPLLRQHVFDAGWLRSRLPIQLLDPEVPTPLWAAVLASPRGLICTTPHSLRRRLDRMGGLGKFAEWNVALFDEIDVFLTKELEERRDLWPVLDACLDASLPTIGFTGTALSADQRAAWGERNFVAYQPTVDEDWMPFTRVSFVGIENQLVQVADERIRSELAVAYHRFEGLGGNPRSWRQITDEARKPGELGGAAREILGLHSERLQLFEGGDDTNGKVAAMVEWIKDRSCLVLCRFVETALQVSAALESVGVHALRADGTMHPTEVERRAAMFRRGDAPAFVITRDLGGRGLDFPQAESVLLLSPRSNYQTVAQELARIRSRRSEPKNAAVLYYSRTAETAKAARLAEHLVHDHRYGEFPLFETLEAPQALDLDDPDRRHLYVEEALADH